MLLPIRNVLRSVRDTRLGTQRRCRPAFAGAAASRPGIGCPGYPPCSLPPIGPVGGELGSPLRFSFPLRSGQGPLLWGVPAPEPSSVSFLAITPPCDDPAGHLRPSGFPPSPLPRSSLSGDGTGNPRKSGGSAEPPLGPAQEPPGTRVALARGRETRRGEQTRRAGFPPSASRCTCRTGSCLRSPAGSTETSPYLRNAPISSVSGEERRRPIRSEGSLRAAPQSGL